MLVSSSNARTNVTLFLRSSIVNWKTIGPMRCKEGSSLPLGFKFVARHGSASVGRAFHSYSFGTSFHGIHVGSAALMPSHTDAASLALASFLLVVLKETVSTSCIVPRRRRNALDVKEEELLFNTREKPSARTRWATNRRSWDPIHRRVDGGERHIARVEVV